MKMPASSAASRIADPAKTGAAAFEAWKNTFPATVVDPTPFAVGSRLMVPKASVLICP
jgi:hypothetical protein